MVVVTKCLPWVNVSWPTNFSAPNFAPYFHKWGSLTSDLRPKARKSFVVNNDKKDQARRALDDALGGKKDEYEKWTKEIQKRKERSGGFGGGNPPGRGRTRWSDWGGRSGGFNGGHFWLQICLTVVGAVLLYLITSRRDLLVDGFFKPLLKQRGGSSSTSHSDLHSTRKDYNKTLSAKERVIRKWGSD